MENEVYLDGETELCLPPRQAAMVEAGEPLGAVVIATTDLMFRSKIQTVAEHYGLEFTFTKTEEAAMRAVAGDDVSMLLVDLEADHRIPSVPLVERARKYSSDLVIIGFVRHIHEELRDASLAAGMTRCYTRAQFTALLPEILGLLVKPVEG